MRRCCSPSSASPSSSQGWRSASRCRRPSVPSWLPWPCRVPYSARRRPGGAAAPPVRGHLLPVLLLSDRPGIAGRPRRSRHGAHRRHRAGKLVSGRAASRPLGVGPGGQLRAGTALISRGEFSIVIASLGAGGEHGEELGALAAAHVLLTAIAGPLAAKYAGRHPFPRTLQTGGPEWHRSVTPRRGGCSNLNATVRIPRLRRLPVRLGIRSSRRSSRGMDTVSASAADARSWA